MLNRAIIATVLAAAFLTVPAGAMTVKNKDQTTAVFLYTPKGGAARRHGFFGPVALSAAHESAHVEAHTRKCSLGYISMHWLQGVKGAPRTSFVLSRPKAAL